ncbi:GNAT family N-acetyltransferase [Chelativorans sp. YIM 93263]|uniref:GNAT family N-acetyltransferase n=1 Tax=Chelativorans sp. YIM 93263 TaxID=2906648 RepID=UPI0023783909|nr:GNAT family protein [Chelativorans sp. YIM 93263]
MTLTKPILKGNKLLLRPLTKSDATAMFASLPPASQRLTGTHTRHSFADVQAHCIRIEEATDRWDYGIVVDGQLVGEVVLNDIDWSNRSSSFRIAIWDPVERDKGYGTEATSLLVAFGFRELGLNRIELEVYAFNPQAQKAYEKVGFRLEGIKREALLWGTERVAAHLMGLLRSEYSGMAGRGTRLIEEVARHRPARELRTLTRENTPEPGIRICVTASP